jgi:putative acetyltransferase
MWVYDDGSVKGVIQIEEKEIKRLFVEPALQRKAIGSELLEYAIGEYGASYLWALEKNVRAIAFYERHGFRRTRERKLEEDTDKYLVRMRI